MKERSFHVLIKEICEEMDIQVEKLSFQWILQLTKQGQVRHITNYLFDNNSQATGVIVADKYATYEVLKSQNIPVIKHTMIFNPTIWKQYIPEEGNGKIMEEELIKYKKLVVKPNCDCEGRGILLCYTLEETKRAIEDLFDKNYTSVSICPYYEIKTEYRAIYLEGEILLIYGKEKPFVIGDGRRTLGELIEKLTLLNKEMELELNKIPKKGEKIEISWKHNLSGGATATILPKNELYQEIEKLAIQAGKAMNINFASIDIIQTVDNQLYVIEINAGVCMDIFSKTVEGGRERAKEIYQKAIQAMFKE